MSNEQWEKELDRDPEYLEWSDRRYQDSINFREETEMAWEPKEMGGGLYKNEKRDNEKHPLYKGKVMIEGKIWAIAAWMAETKDGSDYLSLKFSEPRSFESVSTTDKFESHYEKGKAPF